MTNMRRISIILMLFIIGLMLTQKPVIAEETHSISLKSGYNLISLPVIPKDTRIAFVFSSITTQVRDVWEYNPSDVVDPWKHYRPGLDAYSDLTHMAAGKAYWIHVKYNTIFKIKGEPVSDNTPLSLKKGWNTIGWPYNDTKDIKTALSGLVFGIDYNQVLRYNSSKKGYEYFSNQPEADQFSSFEPNGGYYIHMLKNKSIVLGIFDVVAPVIVLNQPNTPINKDVTLSYTVSDNETLTENIKVTGDSSPYKNEGNYSVTLTATDESGNSAKSNTISFVIDKTLPSIAITSPSNNAVVNTPTVTLKGTVDGVAFSETRTLSEGENILTKIATDVAGNSSSASIGVTLDTMPPEIIITSPQPYQVFIAPDVTIEGIVDGVYFSESAILQGEGRNILKKEATDAAGNSSSVTLTVIYSPGELIGPEGGEVVSYDGKARLVIPAGAVLEPTRISVISISPSLFDEKLPKDYQSTVGVQCEPMGLILQKESQLIVKLDQEEIPGTELNLGLYNYGLDEVELLGQRSPVQKDGVTVIFSLWHFSEYFGLKSMVSQGAPIGSGVQVPLPDLLTGSYSYEVSIMAPPGRAKMQPAISVKYNSSSANSWAGYGWSLNQGYIARSTKSGMPSYDDEQDTFILVSGSSSSELVHLIDNLYQARVESEFSRFYKETDDSWRVVQKDGTSMRFGTGVDSKEGSVKGSFTWKLTQITDNNGNTINLSYAKDEGKSYLSNISYNGGTHVLDFYLEDRDDVVSSYLSGDKISMRKRLRRIDVSVGYSLAWHYELNYEYASETNRSLLKSVHRFTSDGKSFPAQEFNYQNHDGGLE